MANPEARGDDGHMARRSGKAVALTAVALGSAVVLYWAKDRLQEEYYLNRFVRAGREHPREIGKKLAHLGPARGVPLFLKEYDTAPADCLDFISLTREIIRSERGSTVPSLEQAIDESVWKRLGFQPVLTIATASLEDVSLSLLARSDSEDNTP